ncbi:MAG: antitoxin [Caulobacteraceae bacterium]
MPRLAKLFTNGRSQAVRLPREFRFEGKEVFIRKDEMYGDVILSRKPGSWREFFDLVDSIPDKERRDFMLDRQDGPPGRGDPFD